MASPSPQCQRCFVALDLPEEIRQEAVRLQHKLGELPDFPGRLTSPANLHLTLKFLGEIPLPEVDRVRAALAGIRLAPPRVRMAGAGLFAPRIVWVQLLGADELQQAVDTALADGYPPERRFMGHITLARLKTTRVPRGLAQAIVALAVEPLAANAQTFSLQMSTLRPDGPRYEVLERYELGC